MCLYLYVFMYVSLYACLYVCIDVLNPHMVHGFDWNYLYGFMSSRQLSADECLRAVDVRVL
jgi:hypothetical protein